MTGTYHKFVVFLEMIKFSHTIFALPFALSAALLAAGGIPTLSQTTWIILAMIGARTAAMALNRLIDAKIDAENPRPLHGPCQPACFPVHPLYLLLFYQSHYYYGQPINLIHFA